MLPTEAFADVVAFLRLFDLSALVVTNALCSTLVVKASTRIRWEEFLGIRVCIENRWIRISRCSDRKHLVSLNFSTETANAEFVAAAFPNCILEDVIIMSTSCEPLFDAIYRVADSFMIKGTLQLPALTSPEDSLDLVRKLRDVKVTHFFRRRLTFDSFTLDTEYLPGQRRKTWRSREFLSWKRYSGALVPFIQQFESQEIIALLRKLAAVVVFVLFR